MDGARPLLQETLTPCPSPVGLAVHLNRIGIESSQPRRHLPIIRDAPIDSMCGSPSRFTPQRSTDRGRHCGRAGGTAPAARRSPPGAAELPATGGPALPVASSPPRDPPVRV